MDYLLSLPLAGALWLCWRVLRHLVLPSPLDNVPGPDSSSFFAGHIPKLFDRHEAWDFHHMLSTKYGSVVKVQEMFGKPALYVFDPAALYSIIAKDQHVYEITPVQIALNEMIIGPNMLATIGERHRAQRKMLNPAFSISHMRYLTPVFYETMHRMRRAISRQVDNGTAEVDVLSWMGRAALELLGQGALGHSFDPLEQEPKDSYGHALKQLQPALAKCRVYSMFSPYCRYIRPAWLRPVLLGLIPDRDLQRLKDVTNTMYESSEAIYQAKKQAFSSGDETVKQEDGRGKDVMSILMKANMQAAEEERLPEDELIAQMSTFVLAGMDTTSSALARTLQLLAMHQDVQDKLRAEIMAARGSDDIPYDTLIDLPFLDAVCRETLRVYAPAPTSTREPLEDIIMPLSEPIQGKDGKLMHEILVPKGTLIVVSNSSSNINKAVWGEDAEEWKPERWLSPLPETVKDAKIPGVYANMMTFLGGGRACIGFKFSQLEMKVVLAILIEHFRFHPSEKQIFWNFANIVYPTLSKDDNSPSLPLIVESLSL